MGSAGRLGGVVALVTGGASGIGRAVCRRLALDGAIVAVADLDLGGAEEGHFGTPPTVCVTCAGITRDQFLLQLSQEEFNEVMDVNLKGSFLVTQAVSRAMVAMGATGGSIVHVGSIVGKVGNMGQANYAASKSGVEGLTRSCAKELGRFGIRCNAVLPGFIRTPMTEKVPSKVIGKFAGLVPMGRLGQPEEVADVVSFLASEDSSYITGASLEVTGGLFI